MNPMRISIISTLLIGGLLTFLLVLNESNRAVLPIHDKSAAQSSAELLGKQLANEVNNLTQAIESFSFSAQWQSNAAQDWAFAIQAHQPLYQAAGITKLGAHAKSTDIIYFDKPSLPGRYGDLGQPLKRLYETQETVTLLQMYRDEPAIIILTPIKAVDDTLLGSLIGIKLLDDQLLKNFHFNTKVPVAVLNNNSIRAVSIDSSPDLEDYEIIEVPWPDSINSALWKLALLVDSKSQSSMVWVYLIIGLFLTFGLTFIVAKQFGALNQANRLLNETLNIDLPIAEQINRLNTLQNLTSDDTMVGIIQATRDRFEQLVQQKKQLSIEVRKLQDNEKTLKNNINNIAAERDTAFNAPKLKSEFLSRMGDEITTPMKSVVSMLKLLSEYQFEPEPRQLLNIAKRSTRTLVDNLNNILDFSKLDAGMLQLKKKKFSVRELVDDLSSEMSHYANEKGLSLQASTDPSVPNEVNADMFRIKQILRNLLGNAIRFTKQGEVTLYADTIEQEGKTMLRFTIKDTGVGIPVDAQGGLFESLEQTTKLTNSSFAGRLRLIVSKHLTELMGGEIGVISEQGKGSQFWFTCEL